MFRIVLVIISSWYLTTYSQTVDTISVYSSPMHSARKCVVIKPEGYPKKDKKYPVVYLLHGYDGKFDNWIMKMPSLKYYATFFDILVVCPDGGYSGWYVNSPIDSNNQYETYISHDVVNHIDRHYKTSDQRVHRAITGLSMGGHGAIMLAIKHSNIFGAAGSTSGVMDLKAIWSNYDLVKRLGDTLAFAEQWKRYSILELADTFKSKLNLIIDCGTSDGFIKGNRALHKKLMERSIAHDYIERSGGHSWDYWINALPFHLLFFRKYFDETVL